MACHGVISAGFGRNCFCIKLEITPPSISNHFRYGTTEFIRTTKGSRQTKEAETDMFDARQPPRHMLDSTHSVAYKLSALRCVSGSAIIEPVVP